jgi:hypothetical protein
MAFKFYIDGQLTDQPDNDTELSTTLKRDSDLGGFVITQEVTLSYTANNAPPSGTVSGYAYLKSKFDSGTCNIMEIVIYDEVSPTVTDRIYTGTISVPSMEILEHAGPKITVKIDDNGFYAYIKNNKNIPFNLFSTRTKNGELITPPSVYEVDMFDSLTGTYLSTIGNMYQGYWLFDVLTFLVAAISDNKVTFASDYLESGSVPIFIFDGYALSHPNSPPAITVSFDQILQELRKLKNLSFFFLQNDPDNPVLRFEPTSWFYFGTNVMEFTEPKEVRTSIKASKIYGTIRAGSEYNPGGAAPVYTWIAGTSYYGWKEEVYTPLGQCNKDNELDLLNAFYISSNAVNDQVNGVVDSNQDAVFLVETETPDPNTLTVFAKAYDTYATAPVKFYNIGLNNVNKIALHGGNFQSAITNTQNAGTNGFHATMGQDITLVDQTAGSGSNFPQTVEPLPFADEFGGGNFDPGGNYNNITFEYTAPSPGNYSFAINLNLNMENFKECATGGSLLEINTGNQTFTALNYGFSVDLSIVAYTDATLTTEVTSSTVSLVHYVNGDYTLPISLVAPLNPGNVVVGRAVIQSQRFAPAVFGMTPIPSGYTFQNCSYGTGEPRQRIIAYEDSTFECNGTPDGGLVIAPYDPELYVVKQHEFEYDISAGEFQSIAAMPLGAFLVTKDGLTRTTWIEEMQYNNWTGKTRLKMISKDATTAE